LSLGDGNFYDALDDPDQPLPHDGEWARATGTTADDGRGVEEVSNVHALHSKEANGALLRGLFGAMVTAPAHTVSAATSLTFVETASAVGPVGFPAGVQGAWVDARSASEPH
jgi:hypothetical protein